MLHLLLFVGLVHAAPVQHDGPRAPERAYEYKTHGDVRPDPYSWLSQRNDPETLRYLRAENAYAERIMKPYEALRKTIHAELKSHIKRTDESSPVRDKNYLYYWKLKKGAEYPVHYRRAVENPESESLVLDENELAKGKHFLSIGAMEVSDRGDRLAYTLDAKGDRLNTIYIKDLKTGRTMKDTIIGAGPSLAWDADGKSVFYVKLDDVTLRSRAIYRHVIGQTKDELVYDEADEKFDVDLERSLSGKYIFISSQSRATSDIRFIESAKPGEKPKLFQERTENVLYSVEDGGDRFFVRTNLKAINYRLMETPIDKTSVANWKEYGPQTSAVYLEKMLVQRHHIVRQQRRAGRPELQIVNRTDASSKIIDQTEASAVVVIGDNREYDAPNFRFRFESLKTPPTVYDYEYATGKKTIRYTQEIPGGFRSSDYVAERLEATAPDGTKIPVSYVHKKSLTPSESTPVLLDGYGAYGDVNDPLFVRSILPLLNRGFIYALAHVRGGADLGQQWYLDGKLMKKKNSFTDFIAAAEHMIQTKWTSPKHLYIRGESAGGLLVAAVINMRPKLFNGVIADVPFVDVMTTMLDSTIPLTTAEYEEWGNPNEKPAYEYMRSYSPYDNVTKQAYPNLLVHAGFNDTQVGYWEPAKWVARLRKTKTDHNVILFKTELKAGHSGKSGRYTALDKQAFDSAFLLMLEQGAAAQ